MKNSVFCLILAFILLLPVVAGCGNGRKANAAPDYSGFELPEETGKLVVYTAEGEYGSTMTPAVEIFRERYPEIEVSYRIYDEDEFRKMIQDEIPGGGGPDLLLFSGIDLPDVYKTMSEGLFVDLNPYFSSDAEIDLGDFIEAVMDGGVQNGRRYIAPVSYEMPLLVTTRSILKEIDMKKSDLETCEGFFEAASRFHDAHPGSDLYIDYCGGYPPERAYFRALYLNLGFNFIDYETGKITIDEELFRRCADTVKLYYDPDYDVTDTSKESLDNGFYYAGGAIRLKQCLFGSFNLSYYPYKEVCIYLDEKGVNTALVAQKDQNDGVTAEINLCAAIPNGSANKAAAWKLLKILLSDEIQGGHDENQTASTYFWTGYPVRRDSIRSFLTREKDLVFEFVPETMISKEEYIEMVQSPTDAHMIPNVYRQLLEDEIMPYIRGEKTWNKSYKSFVKALKTYMKG